MIIIGYNNGGEDTGRNDLVMLPILFSQSTYFRLVRVILD